MMLTGPNVIKLFMSVIYKLSEMIFEMKNIFHNLIKRNVQRFFHKPRLIKMVP